MKSIEYGISKPKGNFDRRPANKNVGGSVSYFNAPASKREKKAGKPSQKN